MDALRWTLVLGLLAAAAPARAQSVDQWRPLINEASARFGLPSSWIEQVMKAESRGRTHIDGQPIRSSAGAIGLMQLMPGTWAEVRLRLGLGNDPDDPRDNILAGSFYLRLMYDRFGYPGLFGAYNAGPRRYAGYLAGRLSLPGETVGYMARVAPAMSPPSRTMSQPVAAASLFAVLGRGETAGSERTQAEHSSTLFVALSHGN